MEFSAEELVQDLDRESLEKLCFYLLMKRESDGINGRKWDATEHLLWEDRTSYILRRHGYSGHISPPFKNIEYNPPIQPTE